MRPFLYRRHATSHQRARKKHFSYFIVQRTICKLVAMHRITARKLCGISGVPAPPKERPHAQAEGVSLALTAATAAYSRTKQAFAVSSKAWKH